jgi:hypothetical protein
MPIALAAKKTAERKVKNCLTMVLRDRMPERSEAR